MEDKVYSLKENSFVNLKKLTEKFPIRIIGLCCKNALNSFGYEQYMAKKGRFSLEPAIKIVQLPCSSKVETLGIIKAFESGTDGIFVLGCPEEKCHLNQTEVICHL